MKKLTRFLYTLLILSFALSLVSVAAFAESLVEDLTVGENATVTLFEGDGKKIEKASLESGSIPDGMTVGCNDAAAIVYGIPTTAGEYSAKISVKYSDGSGTQTEECKVTFKVTDKSAENKAPKANGSPAALIKHPGGEKIKTGGDIIFTAAAKNYSSAEWLFTSEDGKTVVKFKDAETDFEGLSVNTYKTNSGKEVLELFKVPASMNGWKVSCKYIGNDDVAVETDGATITITDAPAKETPAPEPEKVPDEPAGTSVPADDGEAPAGQVGTAPASADTNPDAFSFSAEDEERKDVNVVVNNDSSEEDKDSKEKSGGGVLSYLVTGIIGAALGAGGTYYMMGNKGGGVQTDKAFAAPAPSAKKSPAKKPSPAYEAPALICDRCGWEIKAGKRIPDYCPKCGNPFFDEYDDDYDDDDIDDGGSYSRGRR